MTEKPFIDETNAQKGVHGGHRKRLLARLAKEELLDHELLEILLFNALPRRNTNDIAHRLLSVFGTLQGVFNAGYSELQRIDGVGKGVAEYLSCLGCVLDRCMGKPPRQKGKRYSLKYFLDYVGETYRNERVEVIDAYLLDEDSHIFLSKRMQIGTRNHAGFDAALLAKLIAENTPSGLVMVHNHPYGSGNPSDTDEVMTKRCQMLCSSHNVIFCDHVIYAPEGVYSYYEQGKMTRISTEYSVDGILQNFGFWEGE